jgi:hypothetical protein
VIKTKHTAQPLTDVRWLLSNRFMYQYLGADLWERSGTFAASMHGLSLAALRYCTADDSDRVVAVVGERR